MMVSGQRMVIVGAGECGGRAALELRRLGHDGPITLIGAEAHLPYERPPLSKEAMTGEADPAPRTITTDEALAVADIRFVASNPVFAIDRAAKTVHLSDDTTIAYDKLLLATGCTPRRLVISTPSRRIVYLRTHEDAVAIRARLAPGSRLAVIGGGFIGLEVAASARKRGVDVTVIEAQPRILMRGVPADIASVVHAEHVAQGVRILCGVAIASIDPSPADVRITLSDGEVVEADLVLVGIGAVPNSEIAAAAGLEVENGIAVDAHLRTSDPDIFAAGDCCSFPISVYGGRRVRLEAWRSAQEQGVLAARNMLGIDDPHAAVPWFWSDQYGLSLHIAGLGDEGRSTVRRDVGEGAFILFHLAGDGRLVAASGIGPGNTVARDIRLAEMLIAKSARPDPSGLASPDVKLKSLLSA